MNLYEAIQHCKEVSAADCTECGKEHEQLARWLEELKQRRESEQHGEWHPVRNVYGLTKYMCSLCGHYVPNGLDRNYCPNCGAKMGGDEDAAD